MSAYETIQPPFTLNFPEMSKKELRAYFKWFQEIMPGRIEQLASTVQSSPGFENWKQNFSPDSLNALGEWFATQIETRPRTQEEIDVFNAQAPFPIELSSTELTNRTFSLAMDIGMYLNHVILKNNPSVRWDQPLGGKRSSDYGQPVLVGFETDVISFNAVHALVVMAYSLRNKKCGGERLREVYEINVNGRRNNEELLSQRYQTKWKRTFDFPATLELIARMTAKESYTHSDQSVSWHAHREAETLADPSLVEELAEYIARERDKERRKAAYFILGKLGQKVRGPDCAAVLLSRVSQEQDKHVLSGLLDCLEPLPMPRNLNLGPVYPFLHDKRWLVRHSAIRALGHAETPEAEEQILQILKTTSDPYDMVYCHATLSEIGSGMPA